MLLLGAHVVLGRVVLLRREVDDRIFVVVEDVGRLATVYICVNGNVAALRENAIFDQFTLTIFDGIDRLQRVTVGSAASGPTFVRILSVVVICRQLCLLLLAVVDLLLAGAFRVFKYALRRHDLAKRYDVVVWPGVRRRMLQLFLWFGAASVPEVERRLLKSITTSFCNGVDGASESVTLSMRWMVLLQ